MRGKRRQRGYRLVQEHLKMRKEDRYNHILRWFQTNQPEVSTELRYGSSFQLLVAVVLSAQCTDKRVNMVTPELFRRWPDAESLSGASFEDVFETVRSVSYPNSKARHLIELSKMIVNDFGGKVPSETEDLVKLPGVGRKTANVVAAIAFGKPVIAVDTHVFRVARRIGLSDGTTVEAVEKDLTRNIPAGERADAHHYLLLHGRYVCTARAPHCAECIVKDWCRSYKSGNTDVEKAR